jgi:hypothetical protein
MHCLDLINVTTTANYLFYNCAKLTKIELTNTQNITGLSYAFSGCTSLTDVGVIDARNITDNNSGGAFGNCVNLTRLKIMNCRVNITIGSGTSYGHLIVVEDLISIVYHLCKVLGSTRTLTVGSANLEKLANVYVKTIDITDEMRAEDDLIDEKLPFVVCESTDEGAMLITEYIVLKNWQLK